MPNSARVSYDFYSIWWEPTYAPKIAQIKRAPLAWDLNGGRGTPDPYHNHGTKGGYVQLQDQRVPVPVDDAMMKRIAELSGGQTYQASNLDELNRSYAAVQQQVGYQTVQGPASAGWLRLGVLAATAATVAALAINRRLPA